MTLQEELVSRIELLMRDGVGFYSWLEYGKGKECDFVTARRWVEVIEGWLKEHLDACSVSVTDCSVAASWWRDGWDVWVRVGLTGWLADLRCAAGTFEERGVELTRARVLEVLTNHMS
jgi:hypothetical protein